MIFENNRVTIGEPKETIENFLFPTANRISPYDFQPDITGGWGDKRKQGIQEFHANLSHTRLRAL